MARTLTTFPYKDEVYTIYCSDSATILAKFENLKLIPVDTLLKRGLVFDSYTFDNKQKFNSIQRYLGCRKSKR